MQVPDKLKHKLTLRPLALVIMGVTGSGKSTIASLLAEQLGWSYFDADDFHPPENKARLSAGQALSDEDRIPWLKALGALITRELKQQHNLILACSALKHSYRKNFLRPAENVLFLYLQGSPELIAARLSQRKGHFMNPALLQSQFETLEEPRDAIFIDIAPVPEAICAEIRGLLQA